jgi:hypothetical protein
MLSYLIANGLWCRASHEGRCHEAERMVSHQGATMATCTHHQVHAVEAAKTLDD